MSKWRVALGASIVGVVGAGVALTVLAIGPQVGSESVASRDSGAPATSATSATSADATRLERTTRDTQPAVTESDETESAVTSDTLSPPTMPAGAVAVADPATCPPVGRAAVVDRKNQRAWLCADGMLSDEMLITTAWSQPDPGDYAVYAKDINSSSRFSGQTSTMTHFVAFSYGKFQGARIAFHSMPIYPDGSYVQPLESLGALDRRGESAGCIRVLPADAELIWSWLEIGDVVRVIS